MLDGRFITPPQFAKALGIEPEKIIRFIRSGELRAVDLATKGSTRPRFRIPPDAVEEFLARRSVRPPTAKPPRRRRVPDVEVIQFV